MKKQEYIKLMACWFVLLMLQFQPIHAQRISHNFRNTSMSEALTTLAKSTRDYRINFMYNELEDFTVTTHIVKRTAPEAIEQIIGFYPMKMTIDGKNIFVECTQKTPTKMIGRVVDVQHHPVVFANVSLLNVQDSSFITGGVTNENGQFVIPCEIRKAIVKVSCVGYQTQTRTFDTGKIGSITLKEATMHLQKGRGKIVTPRCSHQGQCFGYNSSQLSVRTCRNGERCASTNTNGHRQRWKLRGVWQGYTSYIY